VPFRGARHTFNFETTSLPQSIKLSLGSVVALFAVSPRLRCRPGPHSRPTHFTFHIYCARCGEDYCLKLKCPFSARDLTLSTRKCCGHFFIARLMNPDRRTGTRFLTNRRIETNHVYGLFHPLRALARSLLRPHSGSSELGAADRALVQGWIECRPAVHHGVPWIDGNPSLEQLLLGIPGRFLLTLSREKNPDAPLWLEDHHMVTLAWITAWAGESLKIADFYELDCSFTSPRPFVCSVPMAVCHNVGILCGL
jgi:hypothetical protein